MSAVERLWPGSTIVCIASGPSLTQADVDAVRGAARVIVVNNNYQLAPWADVLYAADMRWWRWNKGATGFPGLRYSLSKAAAQYGVTVLRKGPATGLSLDSEALCTGQNSGYQAINLAVHLGASTIVLLGYDLKAGPKGEEHWHPDHPNRSRSNYRNWLPFYETLVAPLAAVNVQVINCSRQTALRCFPRQDLASVFVPAPVAVAV